MSNPSRYSAARGARGWAALIIVLLDITWAASLSTQFVASRLGYHRHLGDPLFRASFATKVWLEAAAVLCIAAAVLCLLSWRWRAATVPLSFLAVTAIAVRNGPVYQPARVFVWHAAYQRIPDYEHLFATAWVILAAASVALILTSWRLLGSGTVVASGSDSALSRDLHSASTSTGPSKRPTPPLAPAPRLRTAGRRRVPIR
jgi:hypothetical protein